MLSPEEFREAYPPDELTSELPEKPVSSLRDVQYLYGKLYTLATAGGGDYASYLTPDAARDLVDEPDSLIVVRVDLSGKEPQLADDDRGPVWVTKYSEKIVGEVAHCYFANKGSGIDHSITHKSGNRKSPEKLGKYATDRLTRWPTEDAVKKVELEHEEGWIIEKLTQAGEDESILEKVASETEAQISEKSTALLTVAIKTEQSEKYQLPGDIDVLKEGMRQQRLSKLVSKGKAKNSAGDAIDLVSQERSRTVGTADDPMNYFLSKQLEKFPGLDPDEAWRSHPISEDAAVTLMNAGTFVDACTYRTFGARVYYLPYFFGRPTPEGTYKLYKLLYAATTADDDSERLTPVERAFRLRNEISLDGFELRFYVSAVMPHQMSRFDVFGETMNGSIQYPTALSVAHETVLKTAAFRDDGDRTAALPTNEKWNLLSGEDFLGPIASGWYFHQTFPSGDDDTDASADDPRIQSLVAVLSGGSIPVSTLLEAYVARIIEDSGDEDHGFPSFLVASQYAQLCGLACAEGAFLASESGEQNHITEPTNYDSRTMPSTDKLAITDGGFAGAEKLESFIEDTPALDENDERCASFLLGALVGAVGNYQEYEHDRSTTLVDQFPVKAVTRNRIKKVTQEAIQKTVTYTRQEKKKGRSYPGTKFDYIVDFLRETVLHPDPDDWEIETADLRFYYALGITYGMNDRPMNAANESEQPAEQSTATTN
ncbi:type I-B CRISPR-associated protein Cas8b/Csh1 [Haloarchaeobius sp. DFWS5]|uniref:type I-B CRISPR-associated protein Cas8b/Csh1 n=1 Tax=Haloarchaeobius sp. DFWS5 TaxID=3446114 RepID=UPI003EBF9C7C